MKYLEKRFSFGYGGEKAYREGYDRIFLKKDNLLAKEEDCRVFKFGEGIDIKPVELDRTMLRWGKLEN
jgi:hypothetical protein